MILRIQKQNGFTPHHFSTDFLPPTEGRRSIQGIVDEYGQRVSWESGEQSKSGAGFIALISAIVISAALLSAISALSFTSYFIRFDILEAEYKDQSAGLAEACAETVILKLTNDVSYAGGETIPSIPCEVGAVASVGMQKTFETKASKNNYVTKFRVTADTALFGVGPWENAIVSWQEIP